MPTQPTSLARRYGPWAVVTGASDGIGRAFAQHLATAGLNLILVARREEALHRLADELRHRAQIACRVLPMDLADPAAPVTLLAATAETEIGLLVAAAGFGTSGDFLDIPLADELAMLDVNCRAVVALTHGFGARFAASGRGGIVLMSSLLAFQGVPRAATYAATKSFIQTFAEGLRRELRPRNVDVLAVAPGPIASGFARRANMAMSLAGTPDPVARGALRALGRRTTARPGALSWLLEASLAPLPRRGRTLILQQIMAGMTKRTA